MRPPGMSAFCDCSARATSLTDRFCARSSAASSQTLTCRLRPPITTTWPTPSALSSRRRSTLSANSVMSRTGLSAVTATVITGAAVKSSFSTVGCSTVRGSCGRTRLMRSRTSCAATSAFFSSLNETTTCEMPSDEVELSVSMPLIVLTGFFDLVGDLGFDLLRRGAGQAGGDRDRRDVDVRKAIDAELAEGEQADDGQRQDEHPGEDRTPDAERSEPLHDGYLTATRTPSTSCSTPLVATRSPAFRPLVISTRSPTAWPVVTMRSSARSPATTNTRAVPATVRTAVAGTSMPGARRRLLDLRGGEEARA